MRRITRGLAVVCLLVGAVSVYAAPAGRETGVRKIVKKIRALGDLITVPIPAPKP